MGSKFSILCKSQLPGLMSAVFFESCILLSSGYTQNKRMPIRSLDLVQGIDKIKLAKESLDILVKNGFVVEPTGKGNLLEIYLWSDLPVFITCDSVWYGYSVLLEETIKGVERLQAAYLKAFSSKLLAFLLERKERPGFRELALYVGVGAAIQDESVLKNGPEDFQKEVVEIVGKIMSGAKVGLPFLEEKVYTSELRVQGLYAGDPELESYFKARRWFQKNKFAVSRPREGRLGLLLAGIIWRHPSLKKLWQELSLPWREMVGPFNGQSVTEWEKAIVEMGLPKADMDAWNGKWKLIQDRLESLSFSPFSEGKERAGFILLPPCYISSLVCLYQAAEKIGRHSAGRHGMGWASGLVLLADGPFCSSIGKKLFVENFPEKGFLVCGENPFKISASGSLADQGLKVISLLQLEPGDEVNNIFKGDAWKRKQAWTQLGCWAEMRRVLVLQNDLPRVEIVGNLNEPDRPKGYVAPYPKFFKSLSRLAGKIRKWAQKRVISVENDPILAEGIVLGLVKGHKKSGLKVNELLEELNSAAKCSDKKKVCRRLKKLWGGPLKEMRIAFLSPIERGAGDWKRFGGLCFGLGKVAEKELHGRDFGTEDISLIENFSKKISSICFGNNLLIPNVFDTGKFKPRNSKVSPVLSLENVVNKRKSMFYVGLGPAETLYIVLPWESGWALYNGGVFSYREFILPASREMNDLVWKKWLKEGKAPCPPAFTKEFRVPHQ